MNNTNQTDATVLTTVQQAIAAAQAGNKPLARLHLEDAVTSEHQNPNYWVWLAWTAESPKSTISALQHALTLEPDHELAQQGLAWALAMRDFDLDGYGSAEDLQVESSQESNEPASTEQADDGFGTEALELPEEDTAETETETPQAELEPEQFEEQTESTPVSELEEEIAVEEPVAETEEVGEPELFESTDASDAEPEFDDVEVAELHEDDSDVAEAELVPDAELEPLEAEVVDVSDINAEDLVADDDDETEAPTSDGPVTVLAVDDSPTIRKIVSMSLEGVGYKVVTAADGMEAMQQLPKCNPSLILTDISMPKIDGYQLCKLIKAHEKTKTIPVIMLSGKDGMFDKIKGKFVGCDDYITKPFQSSELLEKVSSYLPTPVSDS